MDKPIILSADMVKAILEGSKSGSWVPITETFELTEKAIVTQIINGNQRHVTLGLPGWGWRNRTIAYMQLPKDIIEAPALWKSEYRDDVIQKSGWYIAQTQGASPHYPNKLSINELWYDATKSKWLAVPRDQEVIGWMRFPRPYQGGAC